MSEKNDGSRGENNVIGSIKEDISVVNDNKQESEDEDDISDIRQEKDDFADIPLQKILKELDEADFGNVPLRKILNEWVPSATAKQISDDTGVPLKDVHWCLKKLGKTLVAKAR